MDAARHGIDQHADPKARTPEQVGEEPTVETLGHHDAARPQSFLRSFERVRLAALQLEDTNTSWLSIHRELRVRRGNLDLELLRRSGEHCRAAAAEPGEEQNHHPTDRTPPGLKHCHGSLA